MSRGSSSRLIGRAAEVERLCEAFRTARQADRCVVLLSGEAGIGKSRLMAEFRQGISDDPPADRPVVVLSGGCVDVGGSLAYLPVIELLDDVRELGAAIETEAADLRRVLGGAAPAPNPDGRSAAPAGRAATFLRLRDLLAAAAADRDVLVVIDDLHWADRSTLEVVAFLARRLVATGVLLLLAYRSDELNRRHPLKPVLADLERHATVDHIRLEPLSAADVRDQVAGILGSEPSQPRIDRVVELADGNPFHVEELLSLDDARRLPPSLREVLDARFDQLDDDSRRVVREAAVIGRQVDTVLLASISDASRPETVRGLRLAVDARVLVPADDGRHYVFRHALLREAVYDDLPLVERIETHRRIAQALTEHPELGDVSPTVAIADRARHWLAARAEPEAFAALIEAARSAVSATAWAEAGAAFDEALSLWDRVDQPAAVAGTTRSATLEQAAEIAWYEADALRAVGLIRRAQAEPDVQADSARLGRLSHREAGFLDDLGDVAALGEAAQRAFELIPDEPPSVDRARAYSAVGLHALRLGRMRAAEAAFGRAVGISDLVGAADEWAANLTWQATAWVNVGELERPRDAIARLDTIRPRIDDPLKWSVVTTWVPWIWIGCSDYERAIESADSLLLDARSRGLDRGVGLWCLAPRALAEFWLGRWDDALATIARQGDFTWGIDAAVYLRSVAASIGAGRGDATRARALAAEAIEIARSGFSEQAIIAHATGAWVELLDDRPEAGLEHVRAAWALTRDWEGLVIRAQVLWIGLWAAADLVVRSRSRDEDRGLAPILALGRELAAAVEAAIAADATLPADAGPRLVLDFAAAEGARLEGRDDVGTWGSMAERFERVGDRPRMLLARQREVETILRDRGDREAAAAGIRSILSLAGYMGADRLRDRAVALARAARLKLEEAEPAVGSPTPSPASDPWGLSTREREVLAMLVDGRTNRQIGEALFISDKTASVHVTHILDKLGVSTRTEAAIRAVRAEVREEIREPSAAE